MTATLWQGIIAASVGVLVLGLAVVLVLCLAGRKQGDPTRLRDALSLVRDIIGLLRRMATDPDLPRGLRVRLGALLVYPLLPIDLIPGFIPVVGYADDFVIVILSSAVRGAGIEAVDRHWPGTPEGLSPVKQLARLNT